MIKRLQNSCRRFAKTLEQLIDLVGAVGAMFLAVIVLPSLIIVGLGLALDLDGVVAIASWPFKIAMYLIGFNLFVIFPIYLFATFIGKINLGGGHDGSFERGADFGDDGGD